MPNFKDKHIHMHWYVCMSNRAFYQYAHVSSERLKFLTLNIMIATVCKTQKLKILNIFVRNLRRIKVHIIY